MTTKYTENDTTYTFANDTSWYPLPPFTYEQDGESVSKQAGCLVDDCEDLRKETKSPKYGKMIDGKLRLRFCDAHQAELNAHRSAWFKSDAFQVRKAEIELAKAQAKVEKLAAANKQRAKDAKVLRASLGKMSKNDLIAQILNQ